jgi:uncharacterized protein YbaA (DUF1428 family)
MSHKDSDRWTKYSAIAEILSSIAILVTLIFLAYQTKQNTDALNAQLGSNRVVARAAIFELGIKPVEFRMNSPRIYANLRSSESLSIEEEGELDGYIQTIWVAREFVWLQYKDGSLDEATFETMMDDVRLLSIPRMREWWDDNSNAIFEPDFVEYMNTRFQNCCSTMDSD